jgi:hypothetical protein
MRSLYILFISFLLIQTLSAKTARYRAILRDDPATTLTIGWDQVSGTNPIVFYGTVDRGEDIDAYPHKAYPKRTIKAKGMNNHFARLNKLKPNTVYYFVIADSEGKSRRFSFRTLPDDHKARLSVVAGGDSRNLKAARLHANKLVAQLRPHFVMFSGDMTGGDTDNEWIEWLNDWQSTIAKDGRITAIVPARGNHEYQNSTISNIFDVAHPDIYYGLTFARGLLKVYTLNSMMSSSGEQRQWLENDLRANQNVAWRFAQYHHAIRPHTKRKRENENIRKYWVPLFERFKLQLALECDSHVSKYTWPIRSSSGRGSDEGFIRDDANGVTYIGEGGWGAPLRKNNDDKSWTRASGKINQIKWIFFDLEKIEIRTVKTDNANGVEALEDATRFQLPVGIDLWQPNGLDKVVIFNADKDNFKPIPKKILTEITTAKAKAVDANKIDIYWATVYEEKGMRYRLQYSSNKLYWKTIATLEGLGPNQTKANEYLFTDKPGDRRTGKVYYRITAIDADDRERFKEEIEVRSLSSYSNMETFKVGINTGILTIDLDLFEEEKVSFEIFDINRKRVFIQNSQLPEGRHSIPINIRHLKAGNYLLEISYGQQLLRKNIKVYKQGKG